MESTNKVLSKIEGQRDLLDRIASKVPGFKGYVSYTEHYQADRLIRAALNDEIGLLRRKLEQIQKEYVKKGNLDAVTECEAISTVLERISKTIQSADCGASSSFSHAKMKLGAAEREKIIEMDSSIFSLIESVEKSLITAAESSDQNFNSAAVITQMNLIETVFVGRESIIRGV